MINFVDREEEQVRLIDALRGKYSSFVAVYGRRRLGKSTLIKKVFQQLFATSNHPFLTLNS